MVTLTLGTIIDTSDKWVASLSSGTGADRVAIVQLTHSLHTTWGGITGVDSYWDGGTAHISIALVAWLTTADGIVIGKVTDSVVSTESRTYRGTLPLESVTVLVLRTIRVLGTF